VRAVLDDASAVDGEDDVGVSDGREPVGDRDRGATLHQRPESTLDDAL
jgi:hypothetical protein